MSNSFLHKGMIVAKVSSSIYKVWSPTLASAIPQGQWEQMYKNTGGVLHGDNLTKAVRTSIPCRLCTSLAAGSWFRAVPSRGVSVFTNKTNLEEEDYIDFNAYPDWSQRWGNGMGVLKYKSSTPQASLAPCAPVLNQTDGTPIPNSGNVPVGDFPVLEEGQHVLIAYTYGSQFPLIIGSLPSDKEIKAMHG